MAAKVVLTTEAKAPFDDLPLPIRGRVAAVFVRLRNWPRVSGAKPLRGEMKNNFRIRTGDYRVIFRVAADQDLVTVWRVGYRGDVYD